ncbi:MAG: arylsulfatase [Synoicihabitans sp.]
MITPIRCFALCLFSLLTAPISGATPPNVIVIMTDDQGWGDLSINGNTNLATPNIDSLARDGAMFDNFYVCQVCAPTRAEFLTGRYYPRTGVSGVTRGEGRINPDETTIADVFKSAGYATGAFGKWHNGTQAPYHPNDRGFDEFYGFTSGHWGHYFSPPLDHNRRKIRGTGYVIDDFTERAMQFISENRDNPFFCYLPYNTPHSPMMVSDEFYDKFRDLEPAMRNRTPQKEDVMMTRAALAMCENIDWNVGRLLQHLESLNLADDTIVIYFSDNGPNSLRWNGDMKGRKGAIDEGGLRSPFLIRWPTGIEAGLRVPQVTAAIDLLPTLTEIAGAKLPTEKPLDGRSFRGLLSGNDLEWQPRDLLSIKNQQVSVRTDRFRFDQAGQLFDIVTDRGQHNDVAEEHPQLVKHLRKVAREHRDVMQREFERNRERPFTVGYAPLTTLPARDGIPHGDIERSSKAPNNSFFKNWTSEEAAITWTVEVGETADYVATVYYTCAASDVGAIIRLSDDSGTSAEASVTRAFDPPLYDKSMERMEKSHYFVKDFTPLELGTVSLKAGLNTLRLSAPKIVGERAIDVHSIELRKTSS